MTILKHGDTGHAVRDAQKLLNQHGHNVSVDGWYGDKTQDAVTAFQLQHNLPPVGQIGPRTLAKLRRQDTLKLITQRDIITAAQQLGVHEAALAAVAQVESSADGFFPCGRPAILFERHVYYRQLQQESQELADEISKQYPHLCSTQRGGYVGGSAEYQRFAMAYMLNPAAAIESCSWGMFQIMGFHWQALGFAKAADFKHAMESSEGEQLRILTRFIAMDPALHKALKSRKWAEFAKRYNGPAYGENHYDIKLARAFEQLQALYQDKADAKTAD